MGDNIKLAVVGSRRFKPLNLVDEYLTKLLWREFEQTGDGYTTSDEGESFNEVKDHLYILTGGAEGVDKQAEDWCKRNLVSCEVIRPLTNRPIYYLHRNVEILTKADAVVAFWDGSSKGTKFVIDYCKGRNKPLRVIK